MTQTRPDAPILRRLALFCLATMLAGCVAPRDHILYDDTSSNTVSAVRIEVPKLIMVKHLDGHTIPRDSLLPFPHTRVLRLTPGKHTLELYYEIIYETGEEEYTKFRSDTVTITTNLATAAAYRVAHGDPWEDKTADHPSTTKITIALVQIAPGRPGTTNSLNPTAQTQGDSPTEPTLAPDSQTQPSPHATQTLEELKASWKTASPEEREAIKAWINEEPDDAPDQ